jgi:hypothetical protein
MEVKTLANNEQYEQGTHYEEESFSTPGEKPRRRASLTGDDTPRPATLDEMFNEINSTDDVEDDGPDEDYEETLLDKIKDNKTIIVGIACIVLVLLLIIIMAVAKNKSSEEVEEETTEEYVEEPVIVEEPTTEISTFAYSQDDWSTLRYWGYSADEIESAQSSETPVDDLVNKSREELYDKYSQVYKNLLRNSTDSPDEAYRYVLANSMFGLPIQVVDKNIQEADYYSSSCLVDYYKIPMQGYQPTIKVKIPNTDVTLFVVVTPDQYYSLDETGNIKISYDYIKRYNAEFYTNVKMVDS